MQISFLLYIGLLMISYGLNKYWKTVHILANLGSILESTNISWKIHIQAKLKKILESYAKSVDIPKARFLSGIKFDYAPSPHEISHQKGCDFFVLWMRSGNN